jgi:serine/threonine protein kinase
MNSSDTSGSPGYMAPEVLFRQNYSFISDFFSLGVILHEIMMMSKPYTDADRISYKAQVEKFQIVLKKKDTPESYDLECTDLINKLLSRRPESRLGQNGTPELKSHVWFKDFNWREL